MDVAEQVSCHEETNTVLYQAVNMFISAVMLGILTWG